MGCMLFGIEEGLRCDEEMRMGMQVLCKLAGLWPQAGKQFRVNRPLTAIHNKLDFGSCQQPSQ